MADKSKAQPNFARLPGQLSIGRAELGVAYAQHMRSKPDPMEFTARLNEACDIADREKRGRAASFARKFNVSGPTAHAWFSGKHMPEPERVREMANWLGIRYEWLYFGDGQMIDSPFLDEPEEQFIKRGEQWFRERAADLDIDEVPVWDARAAAGAGATNGEEASPKGSLLFRGRSLSKQGISPRQSHVWYVHGDSMVPRLRDGDAVLFDASDKTIRPGKVYVIRHGDEAFVKRLFPEGNRIRVASDNKSDPQWADWFVEADDPEFEIVGRVRWVGSWEE